MLLGAPRSEPTPQLSEARLNGEKTPRELAAPTASANVVQRGVENDYARARDDRYRRIQGNRAPEAWAESVGETREAIGSCGRAEG